MLFFFPETATTDIYTLSLHDALPISFVKRTNAGHVLAGDPGFTLARGPDTVRGPDVALDRKSTRLNSSHLGISYAVFCLKKKKIPATHTAESFDNQACSTSISITYIP